MATLKQIAASRINGAKSRGPVTPEGKARVARNGTTHGIYSQVVVLASEDRSLYEQSKAALLEAWNPTDQFEFDLVLDIVDARWRLRRYSDFETSAIDFEVQRMHGEIDEVFEEIRPSLRGTFAFNALITSNRTFEVLQAAVRQQHRIIDRALSQLRNLRKDRPGNDTPGSPSPVAPPEAPRTEAAIHRTKPGEAPQPTPQPAPVARNIVITWPGQPFRPTYIRPEPQPPLRKLAA